MKDSDSDNMVLRSVYLPADLDHRIGAVAFTEAVSKGDVIRELVRAGLSAKVTLAERLVMGATARKTAARKKAVAKRALSAAGVRPAKPAAKKAAAKKAAKKIAKRSAKKAVKKLVT